MCVIPAVEIEATVFFADPFLDVSDMYEEPVSDDGIAESDDSYYDELYAYESSGEEITRYDGRFPVPAIFAAPGDQAGVASLSGGGNGSGPASGGGGGGNRSVDEAIESLRAFMLQVGKSSELMDRIEEDLRGIGDKWDQLRYLGSAGIIIANEPTGYFKFVTAEVLIVIQYLARTAEAVMSHLVGSGLKRRSGAPNKGNPLKQLFRASNRLEIELLNQRQLSPYSSSMIADVHFLFAKSGYYVNYLNKGRPISPAGDSSAAIILNLLDVMQRYDTLNLAAEADRAQAFLESATESFFTLSDLRSWALRQIFGDVEKNVKALANSRRKLGGIERATRLLEIRWNEMIYGIYSFSPLILRRISITFSQMGFQRLADHYASRAKEALQTATRLGLALY